MSKKSKPSSANRKAVSKPKKALDSAPTSDVPSSASHVADAAIEAGATTTEPSTSTDSLKENPVKTIHLVLNTKERKSNAVMYAVVGFNGSVRISKSITGETPAAEFDLSVPDSFADPKTPKSKMTKEQRAEERKNAPKLSAQEKLVKIEERADKLRKKIANTAAPESAPASI